MLHLLAPWGIVFARRRLAVVYPLSGFALLGTYAALMAVPLYEMCFVKQASATRSAGMQRAA